MLNPGDRIGDWVVVRSLGEGGMGSVYECHSVLSQRVHAAVKVMKPQSVEDARERFVREVEALSALRHPAVIQVKGGGEDAARGVLYLSMELLSGEDLEHRLSRGPLPAEQALDFARHFADALAHAHGKGIAHRDIKPANFFVCADGSVRVVDFGIAVAEGRTRLTRTGLLPGTVAYMAPEALRGEPADPREGDIYALGLVLYEMLTGVGAFKAADSLSDSGKIGQIVALKLQAHSKDPGPGFPERVREIVRRATDPQPATRFRTMAELATALAGGALPEPPPRPADTFDVEVPVEGTRWVRDAPATPPTPTPTPTPVPEVVAPPPLPPTPERPAPERPAPERPAPERPAPRRPASEPRAPHPAPSSERRSGGRYAWVGAAALTAVGVVLALAVAAAAVGVAVLDPWGWRTAGETDTEGPVARGPELPKRALHLEIRDGALWLSRVGDSLEPTRVATWPLARKDFEDDLHWPLHDALADRIGTGEPPPLVLSLPPELTFREVRDLLFPADRLMIPELYGVSGDDLWGPFHVLEPDVVSTTDTRLKLVGVAREVRLSLSSDGERSYVSGELGFRPIVPEGVLTFGAPDKARFEVDCDLLFEGDRDLQKRCGATAKAPESWSLGRADGCLAPVAPRLDEPWGLALSSSLELVARDGVPVAVQLEVGEHVPWDGVLRTVWAVRGGLGADAVVHAAEAAVEPLPTCDAAVRDEPTLRRAEAAWVAALPRFRPTVAPTPPETPTPPVGPGPTQAEQAREAFKEGVALMRGGNYREAVRRLEEATRLGEPSAFKAMGQSYQALGDTTRAVAAYKRYLAAVPAAADADAVRELIAKLDPAEIGPPDPVEIGPVLPDSPSAGSIRAGLERGLKKCTYAYPPTSGAPTRVELKISIEPSGKVTAVRLTPTETANTPLGECLQEVVRGTTFSKSRQGTTVAYPLILGSG